MKKTILILSIVTLFLAGCAPNTDAPDAESAAEMFQKCKQEIAKLEERAASSNDLNVKAEMCQAAKTKAFNCIKKTGEEFPDNIEYPKVGNNSYNETANALCYCKNTIAEKEKGINAEKDPMKKFALLNDKIAFTMGCHKEFSSVIHDPRIAPQLGVDDLGMTTNLEVNCEAIINTFKNQIDDAPCKKKAELTDKMQEVEYSCLRMWTAPFFDPSRAPQFFTNHYGTDKYYEEKECEDEKKGGSYDRVMFGTFDGPWGSKDPVENAFMECMSNVNKQFADLHASCREKYGDPGETGENLAELAECVTANKGYRDAADVCYNSPPPEDIEDDDSDDEDDPAPPPVKPTYTNTTKKFDCMMKSTAEIEAIQKTCLDQFSVLEDPTTYTDCLAATPGYNKAFEELENECNQKALVPLN